jgi:hypothetical protein
MQEGAMHTQFDILEFIAVILIGFAVGMLTNSPWAILGAQLSLVVIDWIGRKLIHRWLDSKYGN